MFLRYFSSLLHRFFVAPICIIILGFLFFFTSQVFAENRLPEEWKVFSERIQEFQEPVKGENSIEMVKNIFLKNIVPIGRYLIIGVAILYFAVYAYYITIGTGTDEQYSAQQQNIFYAIAGFAVIGAADILVTIIDPMIVADPTKPFDQSALEIVIRKVINFMEVPLGAIAIILLFYGGFKMIFQASDSESVSYGKNLLIYGFVGFAFVMLAEPLVNLVFYPDYGLSQVGDTQAQNFIREGFGVLKFLFVFFAIATFIVFLYAAFLYITSGDSDDGVEKAKNAFKWAIIGLFIVLIAYSLVMFFIPESAQ